MHVNGTTLCFQDKNALHLYSVNGKHLCSASLKEQVTDLCVSGEYVVIGSEQGFLSVRDLYRYGFCLNSVVIWLCVVKLIGEPVSRPIAEY